MYIKVDPPEKHTCLVCGKEFGTSSKYRYTCSTLCARRLNATAPREIHKCKVCGLPFTTVNKYRFTCSRACTKRAKEEHIRKSRSDKGKPRKKSTAKMCEEETCIYYSEEQDNKCGLLEVAYKESCPFLKVREKR